MMVAGQFMLLGYYYLRIGKKGIMKWRSTKNGVLPMSTINSPWSVISTGRLNSSSWFEVPRQSPTPLQPSLLCMSWKNRLGANQCGVNIVVASFGVFLGWAEKGLPAQVFSGERFALWFSCQKGSKETPYFCGTSYFPIVALCCVFRKVRWCEFQVLVVSG